MDKKFIRINTKLVQVSQPCTVPITDMIGRDREMRKVLAAWMGGEQMMPLSPLLIGDAGLGKNRIVYECTRMCGKELYILQGTEDVTAEELACTVRFSDDPDKKMDYIISPLVTAMLKGGVCFIDEIGKMRPRALSPLASLLDERRYLDSTLLGERVYAHPGFRFIAATNTSDLDHDLLPDFIRSRLRPVITVGYPEREEIGRILESRFPRIKEDYKLHIDCFWSNWRNRYGDLPPIPRDSIYIFAFALNLADHIPPNGNGPINLEARPSRSNLETHHIEEAFEAFHDSIKGVS